MKILTKEEEEAHYNATLKGGAAGGFIGLAAGLGAVTIAHMRVPLIRHLTLPMKAFLVTSTGTFAAIIEADRSSRKFEMARHPEEEYKDRAARASSDRKAQLSSTERAVEWAREHRYHIVGGSWVASMGIALGLVSRSPLSTAQKLVQARVYAQGLTVAVLVATAAFEISDQRNDRGKYETVQRYDPNDPTHKKVIEEKVHKEEYAGEDQWKDMVAQEEQRLKARDKEIKEYEASHGHKKNGKKSSKKDGHDDDEKHDTKKDDKKDSKQDDHKDDKKDDKKSDRKGQDS